MILSITKSELTNYILNQLNHIFDDGKNIKKDDLTKYIDLAISKLEFCFSKINNKYFFDGKNSIFNHLNGDQYSMFLYFLCNTIYKESNALDSEIFASKVYLLNKALHGIDAFYEVQLPSIFLFVHPVGTVLGRANYSDYLIVYQRCGIGANHNSSPELGRYLTLHPGSCILGHSKIGDNCSIASDSLLIDTNLEDNTLYLGNPSSNKYKKNEQYNSTWIFAS